MYPSLARQPLVVAAFVVQHLFRIRLCEILRWRSLLAGSHRHGRVLSKWPAAHLARLVCAAAPSLLPRRFRITCFCIVTSLQIGIILTANYAFLNYLVLSLGFLLLDDRFLMRLLPSRW